MLMLFVYLKLGSCPILVICLMRVMIIYRADRFIHVGGIAIYVNKKFNSTVNYQLDSDIEHLFLELSGKYLSSKALIECIYRPNRYID